MRLLRSLILPVTVVLIVPFLLTVHFSPFGLNHNFVLPALQFPLGLLLFVIGLSLLVMTIRLFSQVGQGTLAPWDPPRKLVVRGVYRHVRNPMISGVLFMLLGEAVFLGDTSLLVWFLAVLIVNTLYFKFSEEPGLVRRFGQEYVLYRKNVPMWIPTRTPWIPGEDK